jgi:DNA-binding NarL/FixJ family response regulator
MVLLADRCPLFSDALGTLVEASGHEYREIDAGVLATSVTHQTRLVVCEAELGLHASALELIAARGLRTPVAVVTLSDAGVQAMLGLGVRGVLDRRLSLEAWRTTLADLLADRMVVSPAFQAAAFAPRPAPSLTARELRVLELAAEGLTREAIAHELSISAGTVKVHLHRAYQKLGASSCGSAAVAAFRHGLLDLS